MIRISFLMLFALTLTGCDQIDELVETTFYNGTLRGVEFCIKRNQSDLIQSSIVRDQCADKHANSLLIESLNGSASINATYQTLEIQGALKNSTSRQDKAPPTVITTATLRLEYIDSNGNTYSETHTLDRIWLEPNSSHPFSFRIDMTSLFSTLEKAKWPNYGAISNTIRLPKTMEFRARQERRSELNMLRLGSQLGRLDEKKKRENDAKIAAISNNYSSDKDFESVDQQAYEKFYSRGQFRTDLEEAVEIFLGGTSPGPKELKPDWCSRSRSNFSDARSCYDWSISRIAGVRIDNR